MTMGPYARTVIHEGCTSSKGRLSFYTDMNGLARERCDTCGLDRFVPRRAPTYEDMHPNKYRPGEHMRRGPRNQRRRKDQD